MPLIKCPDCESDISTAAGNCPNCGRPMTSFSKNAIQVQRKGGKYEAIGFLLLLAGLISFFGGLAALGVPLIIVGFVIFLAGRFM